MTATSWRFRRLRSGLAHREGNTRHSSEAEEGESVPMKPAEEALDEDDIADSVGDVRR